MKNKLLNLKKYIMKIKERFVKCKNKYNEYYILPVVEDAEQLVKIADEYVIEFAQWLFEDMEITKVERMLKLFKKSKGL
jgi:hypothetical protein